MRQWLTIVAVTALVTATCVQAQAPGGGRGGRGLPGANDEQTAAYQKFNQDTADLAAKVATARTELADAIYAEKVDEAAIKAKVAGLAKAEEALALGRATAFAKIRSTFTPEQIDAIKLMSARGGGGGRRGGGGGGGGGGGAP